MTDRTVRQLFVVSLVILALYVIAQLIGSHIYPHGWSFSFWSVMPGWYGPVWLVAFALLFLLLLNLSKWEQRLGSRAAFAIGIALLLAVIWLLRFDSFLYGGGNLRVAQLSQVDRVIARWFEWGTASIVSVIFAVMRLLESRTNWASIHAWQLFSFVCTASTLIATILAARLLSNKPIARFLLFLILFFGGQSAVYFGFVGVEPVVVAITAWVFFLSVRLQSRHQATDLITLWLVCVAGVILHFSLAYLLPTALYFTVSHLIRRKQLQGRALTVAGLLYLGMLVLYYRQASNSLEFSRGALFLNGKPPFTDYGLFSYYHLIDWLQLILVLSPMVIIAAVWISRWRMEKDRSSLTIGWVIAAVSGMTFIFISDPENSMALDLPRLAVYLTPVAYLLAIIVNRLDYADHVHRRLLALVAASAVLIPAAYLPALVRVHLADDFATKFLAQRDIYYRTTCMSLRDVYWTLREMDRADRWEALLPVKSTDYMNIRGCTYLVGNGENEEALKRLYQTIAKLPYWTEPRIIAAQLQIKLRRFDQAKPQIDTCLLLEPYRKEHLINLYSFYRDLPNYPEAIKTIQYMMKIFPTDPDVKTDQMIIMLRAGFPLVADSIANFLLTTDSTRAYPYIIKGMIAENRRDTAAAIRHYNTFLRYGQDQPDTGLVRSRLNSLVPASSAE